MNTATSPGAVRTEPPAARSQSRSSNRSGRVCSVQSQKSANDKRHGTRRLGTSYLQRLQRSNYWQNCHSTEQEVASRALRLQNMPEAHRRSQVPPERRFRPLRALLRPVLQPQVPRLRGTYHGPSDPSSGRLLARASLRVRGLQEGAGWRWIYGAGRPPILLGVLRGQVRGALRQLRAAHRRQGDHRARRQVAPRVLHLQEMQKSSHRSYFLRDGQQASLRQMRLTSRHTFYYPTKYAQLNTVIT